MKESEYINENENNKSPFWKGFLLAIGTFIFLGAIVAGIIFIDFGGNSNGNSQVVASAGDDPIKGEEDAPVTLIKFTDFACPFCKKWYEETYPTLEEKYVDTGQVRIVYKDTPIEQTHPNAPNAHNMANCLYERNGSKSYYEYVDSIYGNQDNLTKQNLVNLGSDMGVNLSSCDVSSYSSEIDEDMSEAQQASMTGTPHFVIKKTGEEKGSTIRGAQRPQVFSQLIDSKLENDK